MLSAKILIFVALLNLISVFCQQCPKLQVYHNSFYTEDYVIKNFLHIPQTNILLINSVSKDKEDSSIIYYNDMSQASGEVINVIKPDFVVISMDYIPNLNKILVCNKEKILIADPYTFKTISQLYNHYTMHGYMIEGTNYAVILTFSNQIKIFDTVSVSIIQTMDNYLYLDQFEITQYYSSIFKFDCLEPFAIIVSTIHGQITWDFNVKTKVTKYHGFIQGTYTYQDQNYTKVAKHPDFDIIFVGGDNLSVTGYKVTRNQNGLLQYDQIVQTKLQNGDFNYFISFIQAEYRIFGPIKYLYLFCGDKNKIYEVAIDRNQTKDSITFLNSKAPPNNTFVNQNGIYKIKGSQRIIMDSEFYATVYDYSLSKSVYYLNFYNDEVTKKFITYEDNNKKQIVVALGAMALGFYDKEALSKKIYFTLYKFKQVVLQRYNNVFLIKNCFECILVKLRDIHNTDDLVSVTNFQRSQDFAKDASITKHLQLNWDLVSTYLDPFKLRDTIWFAVGFPNKTQLKNPIDGLFYLINAQDPSKYYTLKSPDLEKNKRNTNFALVSFEDQNNLEIYGIDALGTIYIWDLLSENFDFKYFVQFDECLNSQIGDIFHYKKTKKLILACNDFGIRAIDLISNQKQLLRTITSTPLVVRAFSNISIIAIGEKVLCDTYIYKYNPVNDSFEMFLTISSGIFRSVLIWIELLQDNTLWIQYKTSYVFYKLGDCLNNSTLCTQCTHSYYYNTNNVSDTNGVFGLGTVQSPYTSSLNFITAIVKAQFYKELIIGVSKLSVDINISPNYMMTISKGITDFDFTPIISLAFKSTDKAKFARIQYVNQFILKNYDSLTFENTQIFYKLETDKDTCGLQLIDVKNYVIIDNIQQYNSNSSSRGCQQIFIQNSFVQIKKYQISYQSFKEQEYLISTINTDKIIIENLTVNNCEFGESFQILKQQTNLQAVLKNIQLTNNYCIQNLSENTLPISLFSAGLFSVSSVYMSGNTFCNKNMFNSKTSEEHKNQMFEFDDVDVNNNTFYLQTTYVFFNSLYSMLSQPSHQLVMKNIKFKNNKLQKRFGNELLTSSYVQTNRIAKLQFDQIFLENHSDIQFSLLEFAQDITFNQFYCINDDTYLESIPTDKTTFGCIQIAETSKVTINKLLVDKKKAQDNSLLIIHNILTKQSTFIINESEFKNLILHQTQINTYSNPIHVESSFEINLQMNNCHFENNKLQNVQYSLTHSTTAVWVENYVGSVIIQNSSFINCYSDSQYNFMYIQSEHLQLHNIILKESSFYKLDKNSETQLDKYLFKQEGGMLNAKVSSLSIFNSEFNQSTAQIGSFLFIQSFSEILNINIQKTQFSEGYSSVDGGAFFIDTKGSQIKFECQQCTFNNIYTMQNKGSSIGFQQYAQLKTKDLNEISFIGGYIKNFKGISDTYFIECSNSKTIFDSILEVTSYEFTTESDVHKYFSTKNNIQQSTLVNMINSTSTIFNCSFYDLNMNSLESSFPLLINAQNSTLLMKQSSVKDSSFFSSAIKSTGGKVVFENSKFINLNQYKQRRSLQQLVEVIPKSQTNSLIIIENGELHAFQQSQFQNIICSNNCNGSIFQVKNGRVNLENILMSNAISTHGGCLYIQGIEDDVSIQKADFYNCKSEYSGGAIYIQFQETNKFKLDITESQFINNASIKSKGGAIYIISDAQNPDQQIININSSNFISNKAQIGGAIYQQNATLNIFDTKFLNNKGDIFGNDDISYPSQLFLINEKQFLKDYKGIIVDNMLEIQDFRSGDQFQNLSFQLRNEKHDIIIPTTTSDILNYNVQVRISNTTKEIQNFNIRGDSRVSYNQKNESFQFNNLFIVGNPGTSVLIEFISDQIYILNSQSNAYEQTYSFKIKINFRECVSGEQILAYNNLKECEICPEKKFSYGVKQCQDCPAGATCEGGINVVANAGYWRKTSESSQFISCSNLEENCQGGAYGDEICFEGHIGALCEECDIYGEKWSNSYSKTDNYKCGRCDKISYNLWIIVSITIWTMITICVAIKGDIDYAYQKYSQYIFSKRFSKSYPSSLLLMTQIRTKEDSLHKIRSKAKSLTSSNSTLSSIKSENPTLKKQERGGIYIKIFTNYMQIVGSITTFNLQIPSGIFNYSQTLGSPLKQSTNSLDCALKNIDTDIPILYLRLIFSIVIVIVYFCMILTGVSLYSIIKKQKKFPWHVLLSASMFLIIYVQPDLIDQCISLLSCRLIGDTNYILSNVTYECYTDEHIYYIEFLILPIFLIWVFVFPIVLFLKLKNNKNKLDSMQIKLKYGFLYKEYKNHAFYWEFVKIGEKLAIILFLNFYSQSIKTKGILVFITITAYGILSLIIEPYEESEINQLDVYSTNVCAITILLGLFIYNNEYSYFAYSSLAIIIIINTWFIIKLLRKIIEKQLFRIKQVLQHAFSFLSKKFPILQKYFKKDDQNLKQINQVIKQKIKKLLLKYIEMKPYQKKQFLLKMIEIQFNLNFEKIFKVDDESSNKISTEIQSKQQTDKEEQEQTKKEDEKQDENFEEERQAEEHETQKNQMTVSKITQQYILRAHRISDINVGEVFNNIYFDSDNYFFDEKGNKAQVLQSQDDSLTVSKSKIDKKNICQIKQKNLIHANSEKYLDKECVVTEDNDLGLQKPYEQKLKYQESKITKSIQYF